MMTAAPSEALKGAAARWPRRHRASRRELNANFAPPMLRRDVGILGLLHKRVLGTAHPVFQSLLPFHRDTYGYIRQGVGEHDKQLDGRVMEVHRQYELYDRSIFA